LVLSVMASSFGPFLWVVAVYHAGRAKENGCGAARLPPLEAVSLFSPAGRRAERMRGDEGAAGCDACGPLIRPSGTFSPLGRRGEATNAFHPRAEKPPWVSKSQVGRGAESCLVEIE
jgi:hypothetical protein